MVLARIRAQVVLPTPRGPQKRKACASCLFRMAFFNVVVICACPTTVEKSWGLYFRAETINLSMSIAPVSKPTTSPLIPYLSKKDRQKFGNLTLFIIFVLLIIAHGNYGA